MNEKKIFATTTTLTFLFLLISLSFSVFPALGAPTNVTFAVNLTITGNTAPTIISVQGGISINPVESSTRTVNVLFNASDDNGHADMDYTTAQVILSLAGETARTSSTCVNFANNSLIKRFNCTVDLQYYDLDGSWTINATVEDTVNARAEDTGTTLTYGALQALRSNIAGVTFGSIALDALTSASAPMLLNNTGNQNFTQINVTAYTLRGTTTTTEIIPASNMSINATANGWGTTLVNGTSIEIGQATLSRDISGIDTNETLYFWVDVPPSGLSTQDYVSEQDWIIEVFP